MTQFIAFMAHIPHSEVDYLVETLQEYSSVTQYIVAMELSPEGEVQHFHFLTDMSPDDYHRFSIRVFRQKYLLRGQAKAGLPRQYGKLREIKDFERMAQYTCKDGNIRTNMDPAVISQYVERSFRKNEKQVFKTKIFDYLKSLKIYTEQGGHGDVHGLTEDDPFWNQYVYRPPYNLRLDVLHYYQHHTKLVPSRSLLNQLVTEYMLHIEPAMYELADIDAWICGNISTNKIII